MRTGPLFREPATILMHLDSGYTRIRVRTGGYEWEIPTEKIPQELRRVGSRMLVIMRRFRVDITDSADDIRRAIDQLEVHPLPEDMR
ncbi:MAG: hypothetical protein JNG89_08915 [Planctomycetaceae bacterium]|nr:hypothetical protein [Planctomycetaceae bacterium]